MITLKLMEVIKLHYAVEELMSKPFSYMISRWLIDIYDHTEKEVKSYENAIKKLLKDHPHKPLKNGMLEFGSAEVRASYQQALDKLHESNIKLQVDTMAMEPFLDELSTSGERISPMNIKHMHLVLRRTDVEKV